MKINFPRKCKEHGLINCPNPQCNPKNTSNQIIEKVERTINNMGLKPIKPNKNKKQTNE